MSFVPLAHDVGPACEPVLVEPPGRGSRIDEPSEPTYAALLARLGRELTPLVDRPSILFGHSMGALLAHGVAQCLGVRKRWLRAVVVSASRPPDPGSADSGDPAGTRPARCRSALLAELARLGGVPPSTLAEPDLREYVLDLFEQDMRMVDSYVAPTVSVPGSVPYHHWFGRDDPDASASDSQGWMEAVGRPVVPRPFPGGHFYLRDGSLAGRALAELVATVAAGEVGVRSEVSRPPESSPV